MQGTPFASFPRYRVAENGEDEQKKIGVQGVMPPVQGVMPASTRSDARTGA